MSTNVADNLSMTAWKTGILILKLMSCLAAGEKGDQVQQVSEVDTEDT